ncbi:MAG: PDZ domain-containing protein [Myxococcales bacterium]|nr:PDZ domain-containing protein [Myxococcales bacterium]
MNLLDSSDTFISLVDSTGPAIARVEAPRSAGITGLLWSDEGIVITAHHALRRDEPLRVALGEHEPRDARLLGRDPVTDLAVLQVSTEGLDPAPRAPKWRDSSSLRVGALGLALARPGRTVRAGLALVAVVGESLRTPGGRALTPYVELDRALPRGFSLAPVLDGHGEVLGLATAGLVGDATVLLTADTVRASVEAIVAHGRVPQGYLGVGVSPARLPGALREQLGQHHALAVVGIAEDGPAAQAGVLVGDVILAVGGTPVRSPSGLRAQLADRAGQAVSIRLLRGGQTTELEITAGEHQ